MMKTELANIIDRDKYRQVGEDFDGKVTRIADSLKDDTEHYERFKSILSAMRFLPAGRVQNAMGALRQTTAFNCFVSKEVTDSMEDIMLAATQAAETMRRGGGIGYDFSRLRPRGDRIVGLESQSSGPISFMGIFDAICQTISSSGHRRGAQMGVLRIDHPDIESFITAKTNSDRLTGFNISVGVTDEFMKCLSKEKPFDLKFEGKVYKQVDPVALWDKIMKSTWDWAEPGVLFLDTINKMNNLYYCETIEATNPCGEQPLPPYGACLLGSFNLVQYIEKKVFNITKFEEDIHIVVRAMDNVIDRTIYPLEQQKTEAVNKRRMGLGVTGLANCAEMCGYPYASEEFMRFAGKIFRVLRDQAYSASSDLALEKGSFPLFDKEKYMQSKFISTLPAWLKDKISLQGMRNSHVTSIAPTGTISLCSDNVSSGIEPPFSMEYDRAVRSSSLGIDEIQTFRCEDYAYSKGVVGLTADQISGADHAKVLTLASKYVDSAVSKTCNVGDDVSYDDFKMLYQNAWRDGCKGITTFRAAGKRFGILNKVEEEQPEEKAEACFIDPATGQRECE